MRNSARSFLVFLTAIVGCAFVHELGHCIAGWVQGVVVVPTPFKEYVLLDEIDWSRQIWIAFGGVAATVALVTGTIIWYMRRDRRNGDAILAGVLLTPFAYSLRFLLVGRGHDGLEWQAAQAAIGASPQGHVVDYVLLITLLLGSIAWVIHRRSAFRVTSLFKVVGLIVVGITVLIVLQVVNNRLFDGFFPKTRIINVPSTVQSN